MKKTLLTICSLLLGVSSMTVGELKPKKAILQQIKSKDLMDSTAMKHNFKYDDNSFSQASPNSQKGGVRSYYYLVSSYQSSSYNSAKGGVKFYYFQDGIVSYYRPSSSSSYSSSSSSYYSPSSSSSSSYSPSSSSSSSYSPSSYSSRGNSSSKGNSSSRGNTTSKGNSSSRGNTTSKGNSSSIGNSTSIGVYQDKRAVEIAKAYADQGTGAKVDIQITKIRSVTKNCFSLGHYFMVGYKAPSKSIMHRYCTNAKNVKTVFRKPQSFTEGWDDKGTGGKVDGSFWLPNCPRGFQALGSLAIHIKNGKTPTTKNFPEFRCISNHFVQKAQYKATVWKGSKRGTYRAQLYSVHGSPFFMSQKLDGTKIAKIYKLRTNIKGRGF